MSALKASLVSWLRRSERFTKIDMLYLASGSFWSGVGIVASGLIALCTAVAFANLISKETYGTYQYVLSTVGLLSILGLPGLKTAISYATSRGNDGSFFDAIRAKIRWSLLSALAALAIAAYYTLQGNMVLGAAFFIVAVFLPWWDVYGSYVPYLQGKKRFATLTLYETAAQMVNAAAIVLVMWLTDGLLPLLAVFFMSWTVARLVAFHRALRVAPPNTNREPSMLSYGKHLSLMSVAGTLSSNLDKILLWQFLGPIGVAVYTFALAVPQRGIGALASINRLYFPKAAVRSLQEIRVPLLQRVSLLGVITLGIAGMYVLAAPLLFSLVFPQYLEAIPYTQAAALLLALQPFSLFATALSAHARKRELYYYNVLPPLVQVALLVGLVPLYGLWGAILAVLITEVFQSILISVLFLHATLSTQSLKSSTTSSPEATSTHE